MARKPPTPLKQGKSDNCALACLRSLLLAHGIEVAEEVLEIHANKQGWGVEIEDLARAANHFGFLAQTIRLDLAGIAHRLARGLFPIVYLNRIHLQKRFPIARQTALR